MEERREELINNYIPLAKSICKEFSNLGHQERYSDALFGLYKAAKNFDFENYSIKRFPNYAKTIIRNRLRQLYNSQKDVLPVDWNGVEASDDSQSHTLTSHLKDNEDEYYNIEALETCKRMLSGDKYKIAICLMNNYTQNEIAEIMGLSQPTVSRRISNIKEELYEYFEK